MSSSIGKDPILSVIQDANKISIPERSIPRAILCFFRVLGLKIQQIFYTPQKIAASVLDKLTKSELDGQDLASFSMKTIRALPQARLSKNKILEAIQASNVFGIKVALAELVEQSQAQVVPPRKASAQQEKSGVSQPVSQIQHLETYAPSDTDEETEIEPVELKEWQFPKKAKLEDKVKEFRVILNTERPKDHVIRVAVQYLESIEDEEEKLEFFEELPLRVQMHLYKFVDEPEVFIASIVSSLNKTEERRAHEAVPLTEEVLIGQLEKLIADDVPEIERYENLLEAIHEEERRIEELRFKDVPLSSHHESKVPAISANEIKESDYLSDEGIDALYEKELPKAVIQKSDAEKGAKPFVKAFMPDPKEWLHTPQEKNALLLIDPKDSTAKKAQRIRDFFSTSKLNEIIRVLKNQPDKAAIIQKLPLSIGLYIVSKDDSFEEAYIDGLLRQKNKLLRPEVIAYLTKYSIEDNPLKRTYKELLRDIEFRRQIVETELD